ncbi:Multi antimicrobial extrusion protein [Macleaya cordata]|uniref:Protein DETOXIFICATION n=1 Tax=Macleaya cordata TaxID=56857 RepID=A0A200QSM3_MACCD|nr:Multi antimicrobial extrusion protein [Macleaya cordata]
MSEAVEELKKLQDMAFPITAMGLVSYLKSLISVVCMGRLGQLELAGGSLAVGFANITGYSIISGLALGMDPVCSQAFGSKNFPLVALTLQRTILILLCASIPIGVLWVNLEPLMLKLNQNPDITRVASLYCKFVLPDLFANCLLQPLRIYLRSKGTPWPLMWCTLLAVVLHLPITVFLAFNLHLGVPGIAMATFISNFNTLFFLLCYMFYAHRTAPDPSLCTPLTSPPSMPTTLGVGDEWGTLIRLALPSCLAVCLEWWWYEFMTVLAGYFHKPHVTLATSAIVIQTTSLMYTLPTALSASVSTRVGSELGAGRPSESRLATMVAMVIAVLVSLVGFSWTNLGTRAWGRIFTQDSEVLELTMKVLPIIGLCELANCPQTTGCGVLRGSARPNICATINFYAFYLVGTPVAIVLAFVLELGFVGLCYGLLAAQVACALSIITEIWKTNWDKESMKARDLVGGGVCADEEDQSIKSGEEAEFLKEVVFQK